MGNSASRQMPPSLSGLPPTPVNRGLASATASSSKPNKGIDEEATDAISSDPEWLRKIYRFRAATPFVAVFKSVPTPGGGEDLIVTPIQDHPIMQSARYQSGSSQSSHKDKGKGPVMDEEHLTSLDFALPLPFERLRSISNTPMPDESSRHDDSNERPALDTASIPVEIFDQVIKHLSHHDVKTMRLVDKAFERGVASHMFERVVLPFSQDIYGNLTEDAAQRSISANAKGKARAGEIPPELALDMFRGFGRHIRQFGISFDVDRQALANPPPKKMRQGHKTYWGKYEWCFPDYVRFSDRAALEDVADQTIIMTKALSHIANVQHLALSLDAGLGWLNTPSMRSLRDRILDEQPAIWGGSKYHTDPYQAAHRRYWLTLQETFRTVGKLDDLFYFDLVHLDHAQIQSLIDAADDMPFSFKMHKTLLANAFSTQGEDFKTEKQMISRSILDSVPHHIWDEAGLTPMLTQMQHVSWEAVWTEPIYAPVKEYLFLNGLCPDQNQQPQSHSDTSRNMESLSRIMKDLGKKLTRPLELHGERSRAPNGILAVLPLPVDLRDAPGKGRDRDATRFLNGPQKEWLLETAWAQDAFISTYMLAIIDNRPLAANIRSLTLTRFSSKHIPRLYRDDFWGALSSLTDLSLTIIADWRDVIYDVSSSAATIEVSPAGAISLVHYLLTSQIVHKHSLRKLSLGWADGGEEAEGYFARNQKVLPAPLVPREKAISSGRIFAEMPTFRHLEELQLHNCWITPNMLEYFLNNHKSLSLEKLTLDSVSLTAHPGLAPSDNINAPGVWTQVLTSFLPGLQRLGSGVPQPPSVITGVQQLTSYAINAGVQLPPNVNQFIQLHPHPPQSVQSTQAGLPGSAPLPIPPGNYGPVMTALDQALAPIQVQGQGPAADGQQAATIGTNSEGHRTGSWPDVIMNVTEMLSSAGKPDFEFVFLSCGYVLLPLSLFDFDQEWLRSLSKQVDRELGHGMTGARVDIQNGQQQPQHQPMGLGQPTTGNIAQAQPMGLNQAAPGHRLPLTLDNPYTTPTSEGGRARMTSHIKALATKIQQSNDPLVGQIISALPLPERAALTVWAGIDLGWPTTAMGLIEEGADVAWARWGECRREAAVWDGQKEGGCGRFSGRVWAREGKVIVDEDGEGVAGNGEGPST